MKYIVGLFMTSLLLLNGCTGMNTDFGCNHTAGDSCQTIMAVNRKASAGGYNHLPTTQQPHDAVTIPAKTPQGFTVATPQAGAPVRYSENIQRIWIGPYQDRQGNYHEPSMVYTVLTPAHWVGLPPKAITNDNE